MFKINQMSDAELAGEIKKAYLRWRELVTEKENRDRRKTVVYTSKQTCGG